MTRQFDIREPSFAALTAAPIYFRYGANKRRVLIDVMTASALLAVYKAVNPDNQAKMERMVATRNGLEKLVDFAWKKVTL